MQHVHFWTLREVAGIHDWDPDAEPELHASGYGHAFLELYVRMRAAGDPVSIGKRPHPRADTLVVSLEELTEWHRHGQPRKMLALGSRLLLRRRGLVVVRNDVHPHVASPSSTSRELMPTRASIVDPHLQRAVPLLPQRGLVPRSASRPEVVATIALKAYSTNCPEWFDDVRSTLSSMGVELRFDDGTAASVPWEDFSQVDAVLCVQSSATLGVETRKPATKLVNAWMAGAIPICQDLAGYREVASTDDAMFFADPHEIGPLIAGLRSDPARATSLRAAGRRRRAEYSAESVLATWRDVMSDVPLASRRRVVEDILIAATQVLFGPRGARLARRALS